jgi:hypothetical protein
MVILSAEVTHLSRAIPKVTNHQQVAIFGKYSATHL